MFNLTSSVPKSWQTVSRQADRATNEAAPVQNPAQPQSYSSPSRDLVRDLGGVLRERREAMGASLAEVETATRIRQKYLAALESDEWHLLPGEVVGRGFLRNYATYLGLDPTEVVERRRAVADPQLAAALYGTSAGSALPPERDIDYRPKDVLLKDEPEGIQQREMRVGPYVTVLALAGTLMLIWWLASNWGNEISAAASNMLAAVQTGVAETRNPDAATPNPSLPVNNPNASAPVVNASPAMTGTTLQEGQNGNPASNSAASNQPLPANPAPENPSAQPVAVAPIETPRGLILVPTDTPAVAPAAALPGALAAVPVVTETLAVTSTSIPEAAPLPTDTPLPTPTETPLPQPTETPTPLPTDTPPPVPVAAFCGDDRMAFFTPGVGQALSGAVSITGRAIDPNIDYYKLEYAVGANAEGGYVYFDGSKGQVDGGILGTLNTGALPNGEYTIQLTVVDLTGNYPAPCRVSVVIQN